MQIKDQFTVILSPIGRVIKGFWQWSQEPSELKPVERGPYETFEQAWDDFSRIVDKGGVLFAPYHGKLTYCFSKWIGLVPLAVWCDSTAIGVEIESSPNSYTRFLEVQERDRLVRKIELCYDPHDRWYFHEVGERYPFEDGEKLSRKVRKERFDTEDIELFLSKAGMGARLVGKNTFAGDKPFYLFQYGNSKYHETRFPQLLLQPADRERLLSLSSDAGGQRIGADRRPSRGISGPLTKCPAHVAKFFRAVHDFKKWGLSNFRPAENVSVGEIVCPCGSRKFKVVQEGTNVKILARCSLCRQKAVLYDLRSYPGATLLPETTHDENCLAGDKGGGVNVAVGYEFPDDSFEEGDDLNAISCFTLWCKQNAEDTVCEVFEHETR